jgi:Fic/DOC family protein/BNR repeat protein
MVPYAASAVIVPYHSRTTEGQATIHAPHVRRILDRALLEMTGQPTLHVKSGETLYTPPPAHDVPVVMAEMVAWLNDPGQVHPVLAGGVAQFQLVHVHPFLDGNGRTSRLLSTLCLYRAGYDFKRLFTISEYCDRDRSSFYQAIQGVRQRGMNMTGWLEFSTEGLATQLGEVRKRGERVIRRDVLARQQHLSDRQAKALGYVLEHGNLRIQDYETLCPGVGRRSLQRDLKVMLDKELLVAVGATNRLVYRIKEVGGGLATNSRRKLMTSPVLTQISIPTVDISAQTERHTIVAQGTEREWQGHPHTLLMPDGRTMFCVWQGRRDGSGTHGAPVGYLKRSDNGGLTWSDYIKVPSNWLEIGRGHPTIHRLVHAESVARLFIFCRDEQRKTFLQAVSEDEGDTWSPMRPLGLIDADGAPIVGWTAPITIVEAMGPNGIKKHLMWYERTRDGGPNVGVIWQSASYDGGLTWGESKAVVDKEGASEPAVIRSPDGKQLLMLIREDNRRLNSLFSVSADEGETWSDPQQLPLALTGDRHLPRYAPDGRLVVIFRERVVRKNWDSHCTAWVGRYEDIVEGREGQYRIKLLHSYAGRDHTYPGLELLPDGTFVGTTYIKYTPGPEMHSVVSVRFRVDDID